jgi:ATP-dependent RNA helicase RhlE
MSFNEFNFHETIRANIEALGYTQPTPIQAQAIAPILNGSDVMGLAQTGTGKTAAFVLPILQHLMQGPRRHLRALIIAPTRELTEQINKVVGQLGRGTGVRSLSIYGGVNINPQVASIKRGVEIICACPGRLLDHTQRGTLDVSSVDLLVLDEADHMFDMGFLPDIKKIIRALPPRRQTLLFSATMPEAIRRLTTTVLNNPVCVQIGHTAPVESVSHVFYPVQTDRKTDLLKILLAAGQTGPVLVFARTKMRVKKIARQLEGAGYQATALHGNLSQNNRQKALDGFGRGTYTILVATDVAARGIDVSGISHVINYDIPDTVDAYTHRTGRTGRASSTGEAFTFVTGSDSGTAGLIKRMLGERVRYGRMEGFGSGTPEAPVRPRRQTHKPRRAPSQANRASKHNGRHGYNGRVSGRRAPQHAA